jgi:cytochrome bd-type quinol oxidase subunit 2
MKLSEKVLNYEVVDSLEVKTKQNFLGIATAILMLSFLCGTLPHFLGYNISQLSGRVSTIIWIFFVLLLILQYSKFVKICKDTHVFKGKKVILFFIIFSILLTTSMCISAAFTTTYEAIGESEFVIDMNMFFYFVVFFPIFIIYIVFSYHAFLGKISEYIRAKK